MIRSWARRVVGLDTETTGFLETGRIVEFGAVVQEDGFVVKTYSFFVNPPDVDWEDPAVKEAIKVNNISLKDIQEAQPFYKHFSTVKSAITQADVRVGHNIAFDLGMLKKEFSIALKDGKVSKEDGRGPKVVSLDTMILDFYLQPDAQFHNLESVGKRWHVHSWQKHRALGDADAAVRILLAMSFHLPENLDEVDHINKVMTEEFNKYRESKKSTRLNS